jgi:hypothetical protein
MMRGTQTARQLRGIAGLQALLRAEGLDAEARLLPALAEDVDLGAVALNLCGRLPVVTWNILAAEVGEGAPAIAAGFDFFQVVVMYGAEPFALAPRRELWRNASDDAARVAGVLWEPTEGRYAWSKRLRKNVHVLRIARKAETATIHVRRGSKGKLVTFRREPLSTLSEPRVLVGGDDAHAGRYVEHHTLAGRVELARYAGDVDTPQWLVVLKSEKYAVLDLGSRSGMSISRVGGGLAPVWTGRRTPAGYETLTTTLSGALLDELLALARDGDPKRKGRAR